MICGLRRSGVRSAGRWWKLQIRPEVFEGGGADSFDSEKVVEGLVGGLVGVLFLELLAVFEDSAGHGGAEVGDGREVGGAGDVGVDFVLEFGGARGLCWLGVGDARGGEL